MTTDMGDERSVFYERLYTLPLVHELVRQAVQRYQQTKILYPSLDKALTSVETGVSQVAERAKPAYDDYFQDKVALANKSACETLTYLEKNYPQIKITPEELQQIGMDYYDQSVWQRAVNTAFATRDQAYDVAVATKQMGTQAVDGAKQVVVQTATVGVGAAVVSTQLSVAATLAACNLGIDALLTSKHAGLQALRAIHRSEELVREALLHALLTGKTTAMEVTRLATETLKGPADKVIDNTNAFLDVLDTIVDRYVVDTADHVSNATDKTSSSIGTRLSQLGGKVATGLSVKAQQQVFSPLRRSIRRTVDDLQGALVILEYVKKQQDWVTQQTVEGYGRVSESVRNTLKTLEQQAKDLKIQPEVLLLRTIRLSSSALSTASDQLLSRSNTILAEPYRSQVQAAVAYVHQLDKSFADAQNLLDVRDELVMEAKEKLTVVEQSLVEAVDKLADYPPLSWMTVRKTRSSSSPDGKAAEMNGFVDKNSRPVSQSR